MDKEISWDKILQIKTVGRDDKNADEYRYPYEPTPYSVLERLTESELFGEGNTVLDYGCGKGRVGFFFSYRTKAQAIGILIVPASNPIGSSDTQLVPHSKAPLHLPLRPTMSSN